MRARSLFTFLAMALWLGGAALVPATAAARREVVFSYPFVRVWSTAVRLLRVDLECPITEKDREEGYFFFQYSDHGKTFPGSVEFVTSKENGGETVRVVIQVPAMPSYVEAMMLDRLPKEVAPTPIPVHPVPVAPGTPSPSEPGAKPASGAARGSANTARTEKPSE
jgi:hypothetical protein